MNSFSKDQLKTLNSFKEINNNCYYMEYYGDYKFDKYIEKGAKNLGELNDFLYNNNLYPPDLFDINIFACTCFNAKNKDNECLFCRNYDWYSKNPVLILKSNPPRAYSSYSMVDLGFLNYKTGGIGDDLWYKRSLLSTPYIPCDGINEVGVGIAILTVKDFKPEYDNNKKNIIANTCMRLILDYASSVNDAILIVGKYNISSFYIKKLKKIVPFHLFITDSKGDSAILEFVNGKLEVIRNTVATNFMLYDYVNNKKVNGTGFNRYRNVHRLLNDNNGILTNKQAFYILNKSKNNAGSSIFNNIPNAKTRWSIVYNLDNFSAEYAIGMDYNNIYNF